MGFVDRQQIDLHLWDAFPGNLGQEPFRRQVEEFQLAVYRIVKNTVNVSIMHTGVNGRRRNPAFSQLGHLVFHQSDQWRDHQANSFPTKCRHLVTDRFSAAGRHQRKGIPPLQRSSNNFCLQFAESLISPVLSQYIQRFTHLTNRSVTTFAGTSTSHVLMKK